MRTLVIGDIHGGYKALGQCLDRCNYKSNKDKLIFLGDYVDGWSESYELIEDLVTMSTLENPPIFIRGNHDQWMIDFINENKSEALPIWVNQGGRATLESYKAHIELGYDHFKVDVEIPKQHKDFLNNTVLYYIDEKNRAFVHAGYESLEGLGNDEDFVYMWDRDLANLIANQGNKQIPKLFTAHKEVYIGHTTTLMWGTTEPMNRGNAWNLDTGGGWHGKLTIMDVDTKEYWKSDLVRDLYPNEHGR